MDGKASAALDRSANGIIGVSPWARGIRERIHQIAGHQSTVLIVGPSGTGKELIARAIHAASPRTAKPFIPVNCAAVTGTLFTSHMFGHVRGAFTGADYPAIGCFRAADGGTILMDEIGELDLDCQAKLLRVLQERLVVPVGAHEGVDVDVRVLAATNHVLADEVQAGRFRLDLYYRLNVLAIETQGLAQRVEDIEPLANYFLAKTVIDNGVPLKRLAPEALALLQTYAWPGNVRELQNAIERAVALSDGDLIDVGDLPENIGQESRTASLREALRSGRIAFEEAVAAFEQDIIREALNRCGWNQTRAAEQLGITRRLLKLKIDKHALTRE